MWEEIRKTIKLEEENVEFVLKLYLNRKHAVFS